jgi:hypothetical protein
MHMRFPRFLYNRVLSVIVLIVGFLLFFGLMTLFAWDGITTGYVAFFTLGLLGLPTTLIGLSAWAVVGKALGVSEPTWYGVSAVVIALCFILQWTFIAVKSGQSRAL